MRRFCALVIASALAAGAADAAGTGDLAAANAALGKTYATVMAQQHTPKDRTALRDLERAWIAYKEKQCAFEVGGGDGTAQKPTDPSWQSWSDCELRVTNARNEELKGLICVGVSACNPH